VSVRIEVSVRMSGLEGVPLIEYRRVQIVPWIAPEDETLDELAAAGAALDGLIADARSAITDQVAETVRQHANRQ
jgi:hypothetical protein